MKSLIDFTIFKYRDSMVVASLIVPRINIKTGSFSFKQIAKKIPNYDQTKIKKGKRYFIGKSETMSLAYYDLLIDICVNMRYNLEESSLFIASEIIKAKFTDSVKL